MNSFENDFRDLVTRWLAKGDDPQSMIFVLDDMKGDLERMASFKKEMLASGPSGPQSREKS